MPQLIYICESVLKILPMYARQTEGMASAVLLVIVNSREQLKFHFREMIKYLGEDPILRDVLWQSVEKNEVLLNILKCKYIPGTVKEKKQF